MPINSRRSFWLAVTTVAILLVGVLISERLFVDSDGRVLPGRSAFGWFYAVPAAATFLASLSYGFLSVRGGNADWRWLSQAITINVVLVLWLLVVSLAGEL